MSEINHPFQKIFERIAEQTHQVNKEYRAMIGEDPGPDWKDAPDWQKDSVLKGIRRVHDTPDMAPGTIHHEWLLDKIANGWKYGPVKDVEKKEHNCCVPFEKLPPEQQFKDFLFLSQVRAFLERHIDGWPESQHNFTGTTQR